MRAAGRSPCRDDDEYPEPGALVEAKYMGTISDQRDMRALGKVQVLRVRMPQSQLANHP